MARPRSDKVIDVKSRLIARLGDGLHRPGDRFLSNRAIAEQYRVSYQTAHRLVCELVAEKRLVRRRASGTYIPGQRPAHESACLVFDVRASRPESFGARLLTEITRRLEKEGITFDVILRRAGARPSLPASGMIVAWESAGAVSECVAQKRTALLLNDRPPSGIGSLYIDSVSVDDFSGGACAAQLLQRSRPAKLAVLAGPETDARAQLRVNGFLSVTKAPVVFARGWFLEDGLALVDTLLATRPDGIFCCNDRLAEAVVRHCQTTAQPRPALVGFDDAPVARMLGLTTIAIPWMELAGAAVAVIRRRLAGDNSTPRQQMLTPRPVIRG